MTNADDIQDRLVQFASRIINLCDTLPPTAAGEHLAGQLLRSGTTPALNHVEARRTKDPAESVYNLNIAVAELNESLIWMRIIIASDILSQNMLAPLMHECHQLHRILNAGVKIANKLANH